MKRRLATIIAVVGMLLTILLLATIPGDRGGYAQTFSQNGLPGLAMMPSVLACEIWLVMAFGILVPVGLRAAKLQAGSKANRSLKVSGVCTIVGSILYALGVLGVAWAGRAGEFGIGVAGLLAIVLVFPGILLLVVGACALMFGYGALAAGSS